MKKDDLIGSDIEKLAQRKGMFESGHVIVSPSFQFYWQKLPEDPCVFLVIETPDGTFRLTHKEALDWFDFFTRTPTYLGLPLHLDSDSAKEIMKTDYDLSINF